MSRAVEGLHCGELCGNAPLSTCIRFPPGLHVPCQPPGGWGPPPLRQLEGKAGDGANLPRSPPGRRLAQEGSGLGRRGGSRQGERRGPRGRQRAPRPREAGGAGARAGRANEGRTSGACRAKRGRPADGSVQGGHERRRDRSKRSLPEEDDGIAVYTIAAARASSMWTN